MGVQSQGVAIFKDPAEGSRAIAAMQPGAKRRARNSGGTCHGCGRSISAHLRGGRTRTSKWVCLSCESGSRWLEWAKPLTYQALVMPGFKARRNTVPEVDRPSSYSTRATVSSAQASPGLKPHFIGLPHSQMISRASPCCITKGGRGPVALLSVCPGTRNLCPPTQHVIMQTLQASRRERSQLCPRTL